MGSTTAFRTLFLSDLHLGSRHSRTDALLDFLESVDFETLYLVGDIVDGWALKRSAYWPGLHQTVIDWALRHARGGKEIVYIPGNHDEFARRFVGTSLGSLRVVSEAVHETADGRRFLVTHGDEFDGIIRIAPWLSRLGASLYGVLLAMNGTVNQLRRLTGRDYWSLSAWLKLKAKRAVQHVADFRTIVAARGRQARVDGVICGHIHHAEIADLGGVQYINLGDWVESCTALVELHDGTLQLLRPTENDLRRLVLPPVSEKTPEPA